MNLLTRKSSRRDTRLQFLTVERLEERQLLAVGPAVQSSDPSVDLLAAPLGAEVAEAFNLPLDLAAAAGVTEGKEITKVIPLRFVEVHFGSPTVPDIMGEPFLDRESIQGSVAALNEAFGEAGLNFWTKSVERRNMWIFASPVTDENILISWSEAKADLEQVFPMPDPSLPPMPPLKTAEDWIGYASTIYSDPSELLVWVFSRDSLVSRRLDAHSVSSFPNGGRHVIISAQNIFNPDRPPAQPELSPYHLTHELGHFFGIRHTWSGPNGINPYTGFSTSPRDLWDLCYGWEYLTQQTTFFNSRSEAAAYASTPYAVYVPIENYDPCNLLVDNRFGADDSDMEGVVAGTTYHSGDNELQGFSFNMGTAENPPDSFAWGLNVMGYYNRYNAHLWTPGRFSESQKFLIRGHAAHDVPIPGGDYFPFIGLQSDRDELGTDIDDYTWWANGDLTFARELKPISGTNYRPISGDFDANGTDDIFWYTPGTGSDPLWWSDGDRTWTSDNSLLTANYGSDAEPLVGNFDGVFGDDILWYRPGPAADPVWWFVGSDGTHYNSSLDIDGHYIPVVGNFDGALGDDILWYDPAAGTAQFSWSNGLALMTHFDGQMEVGKYGKPLAGDFDGDGYTDVFWYRPGSSMDTVWWGTDTGEFEVPPYSGGIYQQVQVSGYYSPIVGDFDGDGCDDILWDYVGSKNDRLWTGAPNRYFDITTTSAYDSFVPIVGNFDEDDATDIFWYDGPHPSMSAASLIAGHHFVMNNSAFDGNDVGANAQDDGAVAPNKRALLPGQTATFANYTSYDKGINGIMIDVTDLPGIPTASDFVFQVGNGDSATRWRPAPTPRTVTVRPDAGDSGTDRVTCIWPDGSIRNEWLRVTVLATDNTGLAESRVLYFGNAVGESGNSADDAIVDLDDVPGPDFDPREPVGIDHGFDYNRDGYINDLDRWIVEENQTTPATALRLLAPPRIEHGVAARLVFYNRSAFDGNNPSPNAWDDSAVALGKRPLLPDGIASFANYTSYGRGINGIMVDLAGLATGAEPTAEDFEFRVGNDSDPAGWREPARVGGMTGPTVTFRPGDGVDGSDRVTLTWPDNAIQNQWLQVTLLPSDNTGLARPDVFYFGNAIGESGNSMSDAKVNAIDMLGARDNQRNFFDPAPVDFPFDYNRDARVNATDMLIARNNPTHFFNALKLIDLSGGKAVAAERLGHRDEDHFQLDWVGEFESIRSEERTDGNSRQVASAVDMLLTG